MTLAQGARSGSTVDDAEVARFSALAAEWWNPRGKMAVLHKFNPVRLGFIKEAACGHFGREHEKARCARRPAHPRHRLRRRHSVRAARAAGREVVGADPAAANIAAARLHAEEAGVTVDYRETTAEALADAGERFDVVLAMEVVEHVADVPLFVQRCAEMVKPGGLMIAATLNRTLKSFALAIVGAEYVLGWLPRGTHQWDKFVTPNELEIALEQSGLRVVNESGVIYNLLADRWQLSSDMDVNYMTVAGIRIRFEQLPQRRPDMIVELVTFPSPAGWDRARILEDAKHTIPKWTANRDLVRKHFLAGIGEAADTGAGIYVWPSVEARKGARRRLAREREKAYRRLPDHPLFRSVPAHRQRARQGDRMGGRRKGPRTRNRLNRSRAGP